VRAAQLPKRLSVWRKSYYRGKPDKEKKEKEKRMKTT
jgi:hypothetical protein